MRQDQQPGSTVAQRRMDWEPRPFSLVLARDGGDEGNPFLRLGDLGIRVGVGVPAIGQHRLPGVRPPRIGVAGGPGGAEVTKGV